MTDLRTGLVEAMARAMHCDEPLEGAEFCPACVSDMEIVLDRMLGFLTDHADKWGYEHMKPPGIRDLIAVLSDSRDTGEKPDA